MVVHVPLPAGARWEATWSAPEPESAAEAVSVLVARRFWPGSFWLVVGAVLSMRTFVTALEVVVLPPSSCATMRSVETPSVTPAVFQAMLSNGADETVPIGAQVEAFDEYS